MKSAVPSDSMDWRPIMCIPTGTTLTFLRHSIAAPNENDDLRRLNDQGIELAQARGQMIRGKGKFDLIVHSEKERTLETGVIIAGIETPSLCAPGLWFTNPTPGKLAIEAAYAQLGETGPVEAYLSHSPLANAALKESALRAAGQILRVLNVGLPERAKVLVVGHGVFHPIIGWMMAGRPEDIEIMKQVALAPCEGFRIARLDDCWGAVELIK